MKFFSNPTKHFLRIFFLYFSLVSAAFCQSLEVMPLFSDHMVLQQKTKAAFWGKASPGTEVVVSGSWGKDAKAQANTDGKWRTTLKTPEAGGPYQVEIISGSETIQIKDVMVGEVWLCSGQSNMEMPLRGWLPSDPIADSEMTIQSADFEQIRMFTVTRAYDDEPQETVAGAWAVSSPETAGDFSATAFFFGRKLYETLKIPVGLIHTSWGGAPAEAWTSAAHLEQIDDFKDVVAQMEASKAEHAALENWLKDREIVTTGDPADEDRLAKLEFGVGALAGLDHADGDWPRMNLPTTWERTEMSEFDGTVWFRKKVELPEAWNGENLILELGPIDDMDRAYFNGEFVGGMQALGQWQEKRSYKIPASIVRSGNNMISVRVVDTGGGGGIYGEPGDMRVFPENNAENAVSLAGEWGYLPVAEYRSGKFFVIGGTVGDFASRPKLTTSFGPRTPTVLYNAMLAPLVPYSIKGAIWYQGESNVGRAEQYKSLFPKMIQGWREAWKQEFPFYYVQIAPFRYSRPENSESAELRNAQNLTLRVPKTGQVVTLDIGNVDNIHPANKKDVGERLARWALAKDYKQKSVHFSGPVCRSAKRENDQIVLDFDPRAESLSKRGKPIEGFEVVFEDGTMAAVEAEVGLLGKQIFLALSAAQKPIAVRYAWKNGSKASLFNSAGLPASTFEISIKN